MTLQLGVLLVSDVDPDTAFAPSAECVVEFGNVLGVAAEVEGSQSFERGEFDVPTDRSFAVSLKEVASPTFVVLEVHEKPGHEEILAKTERDEMSKQGPNEASFLKDISKHEMTVKLDNGIYRHLRFSQPNSSNMWFDIVTWPGFLAYAGDMGSFVFTRLPDMFQFFRTDAEKEGLGINLGYWGEKLEAVDRNGRENGNRVYSPDRLREQVEYHIKTWVEEFEGPYDSSEEEAVAAKADFEAELREAIDEDVYSYLDSSEHEARTAVRDFSVEIGGHKYEFYDTWEWNCDEYTFRFVWCCYAIAWAIKQYDARQTTEAAA